MDRALRAQRSCARAGVRRVAGSHRYVRHHTDGMRSGCSNAASTARFSIRCRARGGKENVMYIGGGALLIIILIILFLR